MNLAIQRFMMPGSSWKSTGAGLPTQFPAGLRVLVVDDDPTCLVILEKMLKKCNYEATICNRAEIGLSLLREKKNGYDVVLSDVHMPDMDGFKFLEHIGLEMDLPVIMMSADDSNSVVMKGVTHGACDYLIKPVRIEALRNIWQHVVRRRKHEWKDFEPLSSADDTDPQQKVPEDVDHSSSGNDGRNWKNAKRRKDDEDEAEAEDREESSSLKKPRVVWSIELHQQFVAAVNQLGIDKAVPKKILELMNVPGLTRENVASHLQKYRLYLRRLSGSPLGSINTSFMGSPDAGYGSMSSLTGLDLQSVAGGDRFPGQSLATLQAAIMGRSNYSKSPISMPVIDQRNLFSFKNPELRYGEVNTPHLLHGIPTNMEPKQFVGLHQSQQHTFNGANSQVLVPMGGETRFQNLQNGNGMLSYGLGTKVSRSEIVPSYNMMNNTVNSIRPQDPGFQENASLLSSCKKSGPTVTFSSDSANYNSIENNLMSAKAESLLQFPEQYNQDDPITAFLNQQQQEEGFGQPENVFNIDGHPLDDLSV